MSLLADIASWGLLVAGGFFAMVGAVGLHRMPDFYTRVHAASVCETLGAGLMLLGLILQAGFGLVAAKLAIIGLLVFFASPAAGHALAKAALLTGRNVADLVVEAGLMSRDEVTKQLSPARLSGLETITAAIPLVQSPEDVVVVQRPADTR